MRFQRNPKLIPPQQRLASGLNLRVSGLALCSALAVSLGGCASSNGFDAALCTSTPVEEGKQQSCEGPKTAISLTLPRAELLRKVPVSPDDVTGSAGSSEAPSGAVAQNKAEEAPAATEAKPAEAPAVAPPPQSPAPPPQESAAPTEKTVEPPPAEAKSAEKDAKKGKDARAEALGSKDKASNAPLDRVRIRRGERVDDSGPSSPDAAERRNGRGGGSITLSEAARRAIGDHPLIGLAGARVTEAKATIGVAESALYPQVEGRLGVGPGVTGTYQTSSKIGYFSDDNASGATRGEVSLAGRQLLFDFGTTRADIERTSSLHKSEQYKVREQTEDVVSKVTDVYLKLLEQRELLTAAKENVTALEKISGLVEENEKAGNATVADMKRVRSRLVDSQTAASDAKSELQTGSDRFMRLVRQAPGTLMPAPNLSRLIPSSPEPAIRDIKKGNPRIQALEAALQAARHEAESQKASAYPKLSFETDVGVKEYRTRVDKTELDAKGMFVFKYKFLDGGAQSRQLDQVNARVMQTEMRLRNELDELEGEVRKHYRILASARSKAESLKENVATAKKARELYDEQFRGGKRTLLELLDIQTTYYTARRTLINNKFEEQRSVNGVLQAIGRLTEATLYARR